MNANLIEDFVRSAATALLRTQPSREPKLRTRSVRSSDVGGRTTSRLHEPRRARSACLEGGPERSSGGATVFMLGANQHNHVSWRSVS